jgi:hypothetical protein
VDMCAEIMAIGPFSEAVLDCLYYQNDRYNGTDDGAVVYSRLLRCASSEMSCDLARALGFEPWDFNHHWIEQLSLEQLAGVKAFLREHEASLGETFARDIFVEVKTLRSHGFHFLYLPNG